MWYWSKGIVPGWLSFDFGVPLALTQCLSGEVGPIGANMNPHVRLQLISCLTREAEKKNVYALGIFLRGLRQVEIYCALGGTVEKAVAQFFNGDLLGRLMKALAKGQKNATAARERGAFIGYTVATKRN